jgi:hypothetical protein
MDGFLLIDKPAGWTSHDENETNLRFFSSRGENGIHFLRLLFSLKLQS